MLFVSRFWVQTRPVGMCIPLLQLPRCRILTLANSCLENFHNLGRSGRNSSSFTLGCNNYGLEGSHGRRLSRQIACINTEGRKKSTISSKTSDVRHEMSDGTVSTSTKLNINRTEICEFERIQYRDIQQMITENTDLAKLVTTIVFDIETTGFIGKNERIIEIALQDLRGGQNSTFQTLVNPERGVPNTHVHGISTPMVNRPDVPRMKDLIPILLQYVRSRQKPGGFVLLIAHNARTFDVPFLINEFARCSVEIPSDWLFVDSLALARELMKSGVPNPPSTLSVQALLQHFGIKLSGSPHRAMSDVHSLSLILQRLTFELKLPLAGLVERSFTASDLINLKKMKKKKKKKNSSK